MAGVASLVVVESWVPLPLLRHEDHVRQLVGQRDVHVDRMACLEEVG